MFNLIKKDIILQKKLLFVYLLVLVLLLTSVFNFIFVMVIISSLFLFNSQYYDDKEKAHILLNSLPYTRKEIVSSKYIGGILVALFVVLICYVGSLFLGDTVMESPIKTGLIGFSCIMLFTSFVLPFFYKFTQQYIFIAFSIFFALSFFVFSKLGELVNNNFGEVIIFLNNMNDGLLLISLVTIAACCYGLSWILSVRIYQQKVF